jgi:uncharacterized repeat protein (TIGR01451 family)
MRNKAKRGTEKARRTLRSRALRIGVGLAVLFTFGLMASGAFGESLSVIGITGTDTAASSDVSPTATTSGASSDMTSTDTSNPTDTSAPTNYAPSITTDQQDYSPGSTVTISGTGWPSGDSVTVFVNDTIGNTWSHSDDVTTDDTGALTEQVTLPNTFISNYSVKASDASGLTATTTFTDAPTTQLQGQSCTTANPCSGSGTGTWFGGPLLNWQELQAIPGRVLFTANNKNDENQNVTVDVNFDHSKTTGTITRPGLIDLTNWSLVGGLTWVTQPFLKTSTGDVWTYEFTVTTPNTTGSSSVTFTTEMAAGAHAFTGSSLGFSGSSGLGNVQIQKPQLAPNAPTVDVGVTKTANCPAGGNAATGGSTTGPVATTTCTANPGQTVTYTVNYSNAVSAQAPATGVALTDTLPSGVTPTAAFVTTCGITPGCSIVGSTITWPVGSLAPGATGSLQIPGTVNSGTGGTRLDNQVAIGTASNDNNSANDNYFFSINSVNPTSGSISGHVYNDVNGNGSFDSGIDTGLSNITVNLSGTASRSTTTDSSGNYSFAGLAAGTYSTTYTTPTGFADTSLTNPITGITISGTGSSAGNDFFARRTTSTALALTTGTSPSTYGDSLTFTATVTSASGTNPSSQGTVTFKNGTTVLCNAVSLSGNTATCSPSLATGIYSITAVYSGSASAPGFSGSPSAALAQTVDKKQLTVTPDPQEVTYGTADPTFSYSLSGFVLGQDSTKIGDSSGESLPSCSVPGTSPHNAGSYTITCAGGSDDNYSFDYTATATFKVDKKQLTVTPDDQYRTYGDPVGSYSKTVSGFVYGQDATTAAGYVAPTCNSAYTSTTPVTSSPLTITCSGGSANNYSFDTSKTAKLYISKKTLHVIAEDNTVQYSDPTPTLGWHFDSRDFVSPDTGSVVDGQNTVACSAPSRDQLNSQAGMYAIGCDVSGLTATNYSFTVTPGTLTVTKENAFIEYSGDSFVTTASANTSTATINATAVIREAGAAGAPAVSPADSSLGNKLSTTSLTFTVYNFGGGQVGTCTKAVVAGSTAGTGNTAATPCSFNLSAGDPYSIKIELVTNGYYGAADEDAAATVSLPGTGFTTGGGWLNEPNLGTRSNFGFNVKRQKNGSVQGNSLYIYRKTVTANTVPLANGGYLPAGDYNWQIKSNSWSGGGLSLNAGCNTTTNPFTNCTGTFSGKANIQAMSRTTGAVFSLGGNYNYRVDVTDNGEPGSKAAAIADTYGIKVWSDTGGTYYQLYSGTPPTSSQFPQLSLNGGNVQVRP